jgi:hypothetical protein
MNSCPHEAEVQAILRQGHWPEACDDAFRKHVETCSRCGEQLLVLHAFHAARTEAMQTARIDHPNLLWWRAQLRRRNDALHRVGRPVTTAQIFAVCVSVLAVAALLRSLLRDGFHWSTWLTEPGVSRFDALTFITSMKADWGSLFLLTGLSAVVLLSAVVVYLASDRS